MNYYWEIIKIAFYLVIIIAVIYILGRYMRRFYMRPGGGENMELIEQLYLDSKKSLRLVRIKDKVMLFGLSEKNIELLAEWPESEFSFEKNTDNMNTDFSVKFKELLHKYRSDDDE